MSATVPPSTTGPRVAVIGAGLMGAAIAQVFATAGLAVNIYDPVPEVLETVASRVSSNLKILNIPNEPVVAAISTVSSLAEAASGADLVIEAGPENLAVKQEIFAELDRAAPASAVLASNTSAIPPLARCFTT